MKIQNKIKQDPYPIKVAAIDIGTHSTRYMIVEKRSNRSPKVIEQGGKITHLGQSLTQTDRLQPAPMANTLKTITTFINRIHKQNITKMELFGTSALREAANATPFIRRVQKETGQTIRVLNGKEEARRAYLGITTSLAKKNRAPAILDIGGGSTEIVFKDQTHKLHPYSFPLGAVRLFEQDLDHKEIALECKKRLSRLQPIEKLREKSWMGAGGTLTTLAAIDLKLKTYDHQKIHGYSLTQKKIEQIFNALSSLSLSKRKKVIGLEPKRADIILSGTTLLLALLKQFKISKIVVSDRGILFGSCLNLL